MIQRTNLDNLTFDPDAHEYFYRGVPVVSVTQVLQDLHRTEYFGDKAANKGTLVHEAIRLLLQGNLDSAKVPDAVSGYLIAFEKALPQIRQDGGAPESAVYSPLGYAGTVDWKGYERVVDYKSGAEAWWHRYQTAAYAQAIGGKLSRACLYLRSDGTFKIVYHKDKSDVQHFNAALDGVLLRRKHNVKG